MENQIYFDESLEEAIKFLEKNSQRDDSENARFTSFMVSLAKPFDYSKFQKEENHYDNIYNYEYSYEDFEEVEDEDNILLVELANKMPCIIKDVNKDGFITSNEIAVRPEIKIINDVDDDFEEDIENVIYMAEKEYIDLLS